MAAVPGSPTLIDQTGIETTRPVSESLMDAIAAGVNQALINCGQVGDTVWSLLSLAQFQAQRDVTWKLMDGTTSLVGTDLGNLTGLSTMPLAYGKFPRAIDPSGVVDPNGTQVAGTILGDTLQGHFHQMGAQSDNHTGTNGGGANTGGAGSIQTGINSNTYGAATTSDPIADGVNGNPVRYGVETRPQTIYFNCFVKVNAVP